MIMSTRGRMANCQDASNLNPKARKRRLGSAPSPAIHRFETARSQKGRNLMGRQLRRGELIVTAALSVLVAIGLVTIGLYIGLIHRAVAY
jgi:hypothetical protein